MASKLQDAILRRRNEEVGTARKEHGGRLRICLIYPNTYFLGMSSLGFQSIYHLFNLQNDVVCERAFLPDKEEMADLARTGVELVSYESQKPLRQFDIVAFSISYELDYWHVVRILRLAKISRFSEERQEGDPLILAGGAAVSINPEPLAKLVDLFVIGEGEEIVAKIVSALRPIGAAWSPHPPSPSPRAERGRQTVLHSAAELPGVYVPALVTEQPKITRLYTRNLDAWPTYSRVLTRDTEFGNLFLVEVARGCGRGCKFCVTRTCYWPLRYRSVDSIMESVQVGRQYRDAIGLVGAAVSDHPNIDEIATRITAIGLRLSVSSLRADSVTPTLVKALVAGGARSITIAPEAGSERLRLAIGKGITEDHILNALHLASSSGIKEVKFYFMVGLPGEEEADVSAIPALVKKCLKVKGISRLTIAAGAFVPKPNTPYEKEGMLPVKELARRLRAIKNELQSEHRVILALESANWSYLEGALSRGDQRLGEVIVKAEAAGGNLTAWRKAFTESVCE